jgi:diaminohydroxyphosphoribosylaminopyrimidine deaminase/5-amino-6-(5-phosphoribosylamino)uracil reductase
MADVADRQYMARAIELAWRGLGTTEPNPRVGCVVVRDGAVVGEGWHVRAGEPHAEVHALRAAGVAARGATAYVSLEPCCHQGRTPPCTDALVAAGVARVVYGCADPNPRVAGGGAARLVAAGIAVEGAVLEAEARAVNPGFPRRRPQPLGDWPCGPPRRPAAAGAEFGHRDRDRYGACGRPGTGGARRAGGPAAGAAPRRH